MRCLVIADDFTGAAECAGIGHHVGLSSRVLRRPNRDVQPGLTAIDTDTRHMSPQQCRQQLLSMLKELNVAGYDLVYKKTDSVLRGPVGVELEVMLEHLGRKRVVLLPQNPSRGRTIEDGVYRIKGIPLHLSEFAADPTHPADRADVCQMLQSQTPLAVCCINVDDNPAGDGITIAQAATVQQVNQWASGMDETSLAAGGADFLHALLLRRPTGWRDRSPMAIKGTVLVVQGSKSPVSVKFTRRAGNDAVILQADDLAVAPDALASAITDKLSSQQKAILAFANVQQPQNSQQIAAVMAAIVEGVLERIQLNFLCIAGGSTAHAILDRLGWERFRCVTQMGSGTTLLAPHTSLTLLAVKPGSYPWPDAIRRRFVPEGQH